jgi:hypothetical protein
MGQTTTNHRERQLMQYLQSGNWVKASMLPASDRLLKNLLHKGWIELRQDSNGALYRITELGLEAKRQPVR